MGSSIIAKSGIVARIDSWCKNLGEENDSKISMPSTLNFSSFISFFGTVELFIHESGNILKWHQIVEHGKKNLPSRCKILFSVDVNNHVIMTQKWFKWRKQFSDIQNQRVLQIWKHLEAGKVTILSRSYGGVNKNIFTKYSACN